MKMAVQRREIARKECRAGGREGVGGEGEQWGGGGDECLQTPLHNP